jgi:lipopolysaccharide transport protein LptA
MQAKIKRRAKIIKLIKHVFMMIVISTIMLCSYFVFLNQDNNVSQKNTGQIEPSYTKDQPNIKFKAKLPDLTGLSLDHGPYYIQAFEMEELSGQVSLIKPAVKMMLKHLDWLSITANRALLTKDDSHLELFENVKANINKEYYFTANQVEILEKESIIKSDHVTKLFTNTHDLESQTGFTLNYQDQTAFLHGKINANLKQDNSITNIRSDKLDIVWQEKKGDFIGHVVLNKEGTRVEADKMTAIINQTSNQLDRVHAYGNVKITNNDQIATGEYGEYIVTTGILTLRNNVTLIKQDNKITGDILHYNFNTHKADLVAAPENSNQRVKAIIIPKSKK